MPRRLRVVLTGVPHHITQRGNNRQAVFFSDEDHRTYLRLLRDRSARYGLRILGYCLMPNHVHVIAVPVRPESLARALGQTHAQYALALNSSEARTGHLWQNRFFSCPLAGSHLLAALRYVELNPVRAGLVPAAWDWRWSSARAHASGNIPDLLLDAGASEWFGTWDFKEWRERLHIGQAESEMQAIRRATLAGEPLGSAEFVQDVERHAGRRVVVLPRGRPKTGAHDKCVAEEDAEQQPLFASDGS
jgi:putative transposase